MLSRKYYEMIALAIRTAKDKKDVAYNLCERFAEDNPRFDARRFLQACGF
jgi:hypothetical protein